MDLRIDPRLTNGLTADITEGTVTISNENLVTFAATANGTIRRTRWIMLQPGETLIASVEMKGGNNALLRLYESVNETTETLISYVESDSFSAMKAQSISYTLPVSSTPKLIGVSFVAVNGTARFFRPTLQKLNSISAPPQVIACGLINMVNGIISASFPSSGVKTNVVNGNRIRVTLSHLFKNATTRPLPFAVDGTPVVFQHGNKLVCSDITVTNGEVSFELYYVNSSGAVVTPPANSNAQFTVYY